MISDLAHPPLCVMPGVEHLVVRYTNYRGETAVRRLRPIMFWFGATEWHPKPQWLLKAVDSDRGVTRDFAVADMVPA